MVSTANDSPSYNAAAASCAGSDRWIPEDATSQRLAEGNQRRLAKGERLLAILMCLRRDTAKTGTDSDFADHARAVARDYSPHGGRCPPGTFRPVFHGGRRFRWSGHGLTRIATAWLVYRLTGSALLLGTISFAGQIPTFLLAPFAGVLVDRSKPAACSDLDADPGHGAVAGAAALTLSHRITIAEIWR